MKLLAILMLAMVLGAYAFEDQAGIGLNGKKKGGKRKKKPAAEPAPEAGADEAQVGVKCSAFAALKIRTIGSVRCKGVAGADCAAVASAQNDFQEAYNTWWADGGECEAVKLEEAAMAVAQACAAAYAKTIAKVSCTGAGGFACGWSISEGSAYAIAMAKAVAQAAVDAGGESASAFCVADVEAVAGAVADAAASAESKACVSGFGAEEDFQEAFVETVAEAIADAFVTATAKTCDETGAAAASSLCTGEGGGDVKEKKREKKTEKGTTASEVKEVLACDAAMAECCQADYKQVVCTCMEPACLGRWMRTSKAGDHNRTWRNPQTREVCQCYK